jgi:hypothetical protein
MFTLRFALVLSAAVQKAFNSSRNLIASKNCTNRELERMAVLMEEIDLDEDENSDHENNDV